MIVIEVLRPVIREGGRFAGYPEVAVIEDETRRYLLAELPCPEGLWQRALSSWATALIGEAHNFSITDVENLPRRDGNILDASTSSVQRVFQQTRPFVHIHAHSEHSALDGLAKLDEMVGQVVADGQEYLGLTDHGVCSGHLALQNACSKAGIRPLFGMEAYFVDDARIKDKEIKYWHLVLLARNDVGLRNLWRASTLANLPEHSYHKPRMDWRILEECGEGLIVSTACLRGPLSDLIRNGDEEGAIRTISRIRSAVGDNLYLELHANGIAEQRVVNEGLVSLSESQSLPLVVVSDSHYACRDDKQAHKVWMAIQTNKQLQDEPEMFQGDHDYHLHTADEILHSLDYLPPHVAEEAVANTFEIAKMCDASIKPRPSSPIYHRHEMPGSVAQGADLDYEVLVKLCREAMIERFPEALAWDDELSDVYHKRFAFEIEELRSKGFCGYLLIVWDYCNWCRRNRILMGPGRGSAAGSIVCYLLGITQVDPIEAGLLFERFINPGRTSLPDVDSDFPASKRPEVTEYIVNRWGPEHVVRVGTITRLRNKGVFRDVARVLKDTPDEVDWRDSDAISKIIDAAEAHTAGLGLPWDELWASDGEWLNEYKEQYPVLFKWAERLVGRIRQYGKHPAGLVIDTTDALIDWLPMRQGEEEGYPVTEFPMDELDTLGLVKFDILTLRTLDTIQAVMDLLEDDPRYAGHIPHPHEWRDEYKDPQVWDALCSGDTLGVFQVETSAGTRLVKRIQPREIADLCAIGALVRPGPMRSGLTDHFIARRDGNEPVTYAHPLLETVLERTYGTMIYQEDIMATVQAIAGYTLEEADEVRSILGKKKVDKTVAEGQRFVVRATRLGISQSLAEHLFAQMAEFARYSFNKSHAWSYAMLGYWCAWFKVHFPAHWLVACLATADKDRFPDFVMEARAKGYRIDPPDVNESGVEFTVSSDNLGLRYGLASIMGLGPAAANDVINFRPYESFDDFIKRRGPKCNWGAIKTLAGIGALDSITPEGSHRNQLEDVIEQMATGKLEQCTWLKPGCFSNQPTSDVCGFDWRSEPVTIGKSGKPLKGKAIPVRCTKACRQYMPTSSIVWKDLPEYTKVDIRRREREVLGLYVSSTPFDSLDFSNGMVLGAHELATADPGYYHVVAEVQVVRAREDRYGRKMAFATLMLPDGLIDAVIFNSEWEKLHRNIYPDAFGMFAISNMSERGYQISRFAPMRQE